MRLVPVLLGVVAMIGVGARSAASQTPSVSFGATVGGSFSRFTEVNLKDASLLNGQSTMSNRPGLQAGGYLTVPLFSRWSLQPEVTYVQNGATLSLDGTTSGSLEFALNYAAAAALLRADLGSSNTWHPVLLAGPALASRISCKGTLKSGTTSVSADCKDLGANGGTDPFKSNDVSAVGAAGLAGPLLGRRVSLQARYSRGFVNVAKDASTSQSPKNSAFAFLLSVGF